MLTRFLSRLRRVAPVTRPIQNVRPRPLNLEALEAREVPALIYALQGGLVGGMAGANGNVLLRFDSATPGTVIASTAITGLGAGETLQGIDFRPRTGQLVGITFPTTGAAPQAAKTYTINPLTGVATLVGTSAAITGGTNDVSGDIDFNPTVDRIRYVAGDGTLTANARLNPNNGALVANDTAVTPTTAVLIGAAYDRNTDRQSAANIATTLYVIDRATNTLGTLGSVNSTPNSPNGGVFTPIGPLGITLSTTGEGGFDIVEAVGAASAANNNGLGVAYAALTVGTTTGLYTINLTTGAATLVGNIGAGNPEVFDIAVVPEGVVVVGSGLGANGDVRLLDPVTGANRLSSAILPFQGFLGGVRVAAGDVNGDGVPDAIVTAIQAPNGHVKVFDGTNGAEIRSFFTFQGYSGSVNIAAGDVNGDGFADVIVVANGIPGVTTSINGHTKVFSGRDGAQLASFFAYANFNGNVTVAAADFDNDGLDEVVTSAAINGHTRVFNAATAALFTSASLPNFQNSFLAFAPYLGDVSVAAGDINGDGTPDLVLGSGAGVRFNVRAVNGRDGSQISSFFVDFNNNAAFTGGGRVGLSDFNRDGLFDLIATPGVGTAATAVAFNPLNAQLLGSFPAFANFQGGATVGGARF